MSEQKESSVLFSLKELMNLEEDRIRTEEADRAAQTAASERARLDAERSARDAEEARLRAEEERRRLDERRGREENARIEAIRVAEIEKARVEAEQRARMEAMAAQQQHERSLAALKHDEGKKKLRNMLVGGAIFVVLIGGTSAYFAVKSSQDAQAREVAAATERASLEEQRSKLQAQMKEQQAKTESLLGQLSTAKDEQTRAQLQKQIDDEKAKTDAIKKAPIGGGGPRPASAGPKPACNCAVGDPLCSCL